MNAIHTRLVRRLVAVLAIALACGGAASGADSGDPDVWEVSTRHLPGICGLPAEADVAVRRFDPAAGCWERSDLPALLDDPERPLLLFIHGNRYASAAARAQGLVLARRKECHLPEGRAVRTVIFSWPSEQQGILLRDGRAKYERAFSDGHYFAWLLARTGRERPVAIVSYSFGALITLRAMEDLVAAERSGRADVEPWSRRAGRTNVVFVAPAVRCDSLSPRGVYRNALACLDRLTLITNSRDDALRFFPWLERGSHVHALGFVGMPASWLPGDVEFDGTDAAGIVGRNHGLPLYLASPRLAGRIAAGAMAGF
ncbi:MAG: alpha/beta hydrolase [Planctomycetia bacterium]|nr:alpha/beta hydrolase [Planctomycetia bacterium]